MRFASWYYIICTLLYWLYPSCHTCTLLGIRNPITSTWMAMHFFLFTILLCRCISWLWSLILTHLVTTVYTQWSPNRKINLKFKQLLPISIAHLCWSHYIMVCCLQWQYYGGRLAWPGGGRRRAPCYAYIVVSRPHFSEVVWARSRKSTLPCAMFVYRT